MQQLAACGACGLIQVVDPVPSRAIAKCARCRLVLQRPKTDSRRRTLGLALAAFMLYLPANLWPILSAEYLGAREKTRIFDGIYALFLKGNYLVSGLVFTTSILVPGIQIVALLLLCLTLGGPGWQRFRTLTYRALQIINPWNMLPVTLLAVVVAFAELGQVATVHPEPGAFAFAGMVVLTTSASAAFDPQLIWEGDGQSNPTHHSAPDK